MTNSSVPTDSSVPNPPHPARADISMVASDLDGTLLNAGRVVAQQTIASLQSFAASGATIVAATGRSHWTAVPRLTPVGVIRWAICSNGSSLYDLQRGEVVDRTVLSVPACQAVFYLREALPGVGLAWEHAGGIYRDDVFVSLRTGAGLTFPGDEPVSVLDQSIADGSVGANKVLVGHPEIEPDELVDTLRDLVPDDLEVSSSGASFVEITAPGVEKGVALDRLANKLGLAPQSCIAFGDQQNDLGMLAWAGFGYAMANAHPTVLAATPYRAPHHDDHGVAQVLNALV